MQHSIIMATVVTAATSIGGGVASASIGIPTVPIGSPGNAADPVTGFGSVAYAYNIGATEVTNAQYAAFLNAVAASDDHGLYNPSMAGPFGGIARSGTPGAYTYAMQPGRAAHPVTFVSFWDACRFANWLHNGQPSGSQTSATTEDGAYTLTTDGISNNSITRNAAWQWAVTSEDEWYKAAYHQPVGQGGDTDNYWLYPTSSNTAPTAAQANFNWSIGDTTAAGSYAANFYGVFDLAGNVWECNESVIDTGGFLNHGFRSGSWNDTSQFLRADSRISGDSPADEDTSQGFRVVAVPSASSGALLAFAFLGILRRNRSVDR